jgi:hypothetical protein
MHGEQQESNALITQQLYDVWKYAASMHHVVVCLV